MAPSQEPCYPQVGRILKVRLVPYLDRAQSVPPVSKHVVCLSYGRNRYRAGTRRLLLQQFYYIIHENSTPRVHYVMTRGPDTPKLLLVRDTSLAVAIEQGVATD